MYTKNTSERRYFLGIDIGTYESKGVLVKDDGQILASAARPHGLELPRPGWAEHDADGVWWSDFKSITRELLDRTGIQPEMVQAVGCSAIGADMLPVDNQGKPLRKAILYGIDTRAVKEISELNQALGPENILRLSGNTLSAQAIGPKILWYRRHEPELFDKTARIMTATSYLVYRLTGRVVIDFYTAPSYAPLFDINALRWDKEACAYVLGDVGLLPELAWPGEVAGTVTGAAAQECGLVPGTPVVAGTCDAAAEAIAVGVTEPGDMMIMYGTTMFFIHVTSQLTVSKELWSSVYCEPGMYAVAGGMATAGAITRWFRDTLAPELVASEHSGGENAYARLTAEATASPPGSRGLVVLPYFSGERTPINDPAARGIIAGLTLSHNRGDLFRAILEGTAYGVRHHLMTMAGLGMTPGRLVAVGGGTKSPLWLKIVSDVAGFKQELYPGNPGASYGDAFLAALGTGMFSKLSEIKKRWLGEPEVVLPEDGATRAYYDEFYALYRELYTKTKDIAHRLAALGESYEAGS
ncbi:MAG TPA: FGGY-family carbohydrate kinase [Firmicutes bacterium]|nr:FGGY-family carbohydrate kinase [Bacillota bacterium]